MSEAVTPTMQSIRELAAHSHKPVNATNAEYMEKLPGQPNIVVDAEEGDVRLHLKTWLALAAFWLFNYVQVAALQGPAAILTYIGRDLDNTAAQSWVVVVLSVVQAVAGPIISSASDAFEARKALLVGSCTISFIGACIAPGSQSIYRLIGANVLIGVGFAAVPLAYAVPSEIVPRRWRPLAQSGVNSAGLVATISAPFAAAALTKANPHTGWRNFFWLQAALWGTTTLAITAAYHPPRQEFLTKKIPFWRKLAKVDLIGCGILGLGLSMFLVGLGLGGVQYPWSDARVVAPLSVGIAVLAVFGLYEWKGTKTGFLHHELFSGGRNHGRTFTLCVLLLFMEGAMVFGYGLLNPVLTLVLFSSNPIVVVARNSAPWIASGVFIPIFGYASTRFRTIREPLVCGFVLFTGGLIGMATIQPGQSITAIACSALFGAGFAAPLILTVTGAQLSTPHSLIATATACTTSARALAGSVFSAIDSTVFQQRLTEKLPQFVARAAAADGLPEDSIPGFTRALSTGNVNALKGIDGVTPRIVAAGTLAMQHAYADAVRIVYIIAASVGVLAIVISFFLGDLREAMDYSTNAPVEDIYKESKPH